VRIAAVTVAILVLFALPALAETPEETFDRATHAYEQGQWDAAAEGFRGLLRYGFDDPRIEYNLANAEFKRGRLGEAILHYERARRLSPSDPDIVANLAVARSRIRDVVEDPQAGGVLTALRGIQDRLGVAMQALLFVAGVWIVAGIVAWCGARPGGFTPGWGWGLSAALLVTLLVGLSWRSTWTRLEGTARAVVLRPAVEALAGPGLNNASRFTLHEGTTVDIQGEREQYLQVSLPGGLSGWVPRDAAERI